MANPTDRTAQGFPAADGRPRWIASPGSDAGGRSRRARSCSRWASRTPAFSWSSRARSTSCAPRAKREELDRHPRARASSSGEVNMLSSRRSLVRARVGRRRSGRGAGPRRPAHARAARLRAERDPDARVHPAAGGAGRSAGEATSCCSARSTRPHAQHQGVPDAQRAAVHLPGRRDRPGRAGVARPFPHRRQRGAGGPLPGRARPARTRPIETLAAEAGPERDARRRRSCATWSSSAPGRRGWRRRCTPPPRGSTCWSSRARRPADRREPARASRTISAFPPGSPGRRWPGARCTQAEKFGAEVAIGAHGRAPRLRPAGPTRSTWPTAR